VGGGAAGFFAAIAVKENYPAAEVVIFEKSQTLLAKVKISGGGRCNLTNACSGIKEFSQAYPRGGNALKKAFRVFNNRHTMQWFESRNVPLTIQEDQCVFPLSQNSQSVIDCFLAQVRELQVRIELGCGVKSIRKSAARLQLSLVGQKIETRSFDKVIVASGGSPQRDGLRWLEKLGHKIVAPVPSLFTFKMPDESVTELMGIVAENALVSIQGTKLKSTGPLLITHWGMSGPAILKLSSLGARLLSDNGYDFKVQVNWTQVRNNDEVLGRLREIVREHPQKMLVNIRPYPLPERLWRFLLHKSELLPDKKWGELGKSALNRLVNLLTNDVYAVKGRTNFGEEFVTCGGVSLESVDFNTMQSKVCENLYFAGEVLDIDGITGGYNFQAAWTTAFIAAKLN
ncbi:MAG: NAD(P)/FAD-dependent oxidoreductase, partial [Geopsychrobacter sp.]|nr:NAD(P)/FAD-dependent oxidoreductase [Geopsychrobacter sp.]